MAAKLKVAQNQHTPMENTQLLSKHYSTIKFEHSSYQMLRKGLCL